MHETPTTSRSSDKFMLRLPDGMRDELAARAQSNRRSVNSEIVVMLEATLKSGSVADGAKA